MAGKVSLEAELTDIATAIEAVEMLVEQVAEKDDATPVVRVLPAALALIRARVLLLRKVVVGAADQGLLRSRRNEVERLHAWDDPDVLLPISPKKKR